LRSLVVAMRERLFCWGSRGAQRRRNVRAGDRRV
jgi:hypothetical protein